MSDEEVSIRGEKIDCGFGVRRDRLDKRVDPCALFLSWATNEDLPLCRIDQVRVQRCIERAAASGPLYRQQRGSSPQSRRRCCKPRTCRYRRRRTRRPTSTLSVHTAERTGAAAIITDIPAPIMIRARARFIKPPDSLHLTNGDGRSPAAVVELAVAPIIERIFTDTFLLVTYLLE